MGQYGINAFHMHLVDMRWTLAKLRAISDLCKRGDAFKSFRFRVEGRQDPEPGELYFDLVKLVRETGLELLPEKDRLSRGQPYQRFRPGYCFEMVRMDRNFFQSDRAVRVMVLEGLVARRKNKSIEDLARRIDIVDEAMKKGRRCYNRCVRKCDRNCLSTCQRKCRGTGRPPPVVPRTWCCAERKMYCTGRNGEMLFGHLKGKSEQSSSGSGVES